MHPLELRLIANTRSPGDLQVMVQEKTFEYLSALPETIPGSISPPIGVSAYLDRAWPLVETRYAELFISESVKFKVNSVTPGSRTRKVTLPCEMLEGEQLVILAFKLVVKP